MGNGIKKQLTLKNESAKIKFRRESGEQDGT